MRPKKIKKNALSGLILTGKNKGEITVQEIIHWMPKIEKSLLKEQSVSIPLLILHHGHDEYKYPKLATYSRGYADTSIARKLAQYIFTKGYQK